MLFTSQIFVVCFLPAVLLLYYTVFKWSRRLQNVLLLLASLVFYAWGEPWFVYILLLSIGANWIFGLLAGLTRRHKILGTAVIVVMLIFNLGVLFIFKYLLFAGSITDSFWGALDMDDFGGIMLPIGLSFFTFQAISYVVDVYRGNGEMQKNPLNVGLYISFFPQLIAGPILRYETVSGQIKHRKDSWANFSAGASRFMIGFSKKILIANNLALVADQAYRLNDYGRLSIAMAWVGAIAYTLQIFFDFSGYSDMAIGLGRMFGFRFPENFNYPYIAKSASEFWRRWHISLGAWFRDYVYIPMGGSRVKKGRLIFNLFVVWALTGVWHGANWTFIYWGLLYFAFVTLEKLLRFERWGGAYRSLAARGGMSAFKHIYALLLIIVGWVIFRAADMEAAFSYVGTMFGRGEAAFLDNYAVGNIQEYGWFFLAGIIFSTAVAPWIGEKIKISLIKKGKVRHFRGFLWAILYALALAVLFLVSFSYLVKGTYNPFIYFNF